MNDVISFSDLISVLSDNNFKKCVEYTSLFLTFHCDENQIDKKIIIEKLYDYLEIVCIKNKIKTNDFPKRYTGILLGILKDKVKKNTRADKYFQYEKKIAKVIASASGDEFDDNMKNFSRIFICMFREIQKGEKTISDFEFQLKDFDFFDKSLKSFAEAEKKDEFLNCCLVVLSVYYLNMLDNLPRIEGE